MSPHDMTKYRKSFDLACKKLGWRKSTVEGWQGERDWDSYAYIDNVWFSSANKRLFAERDLEEGLVRELIHLANLPLPEEGS